MNHTFDIGRHRPVYLWAGQTTVRMNRLKFMDAPVDEFVHEEAHQPIGAQRMFQEAGCNWAYLMYDWGFPPEIEQSDWDDFKGAVQAYHAEGFKIFGYVQTSNCVYDGSYRHKDWYAIDPQGHRFYYYTGRFMTCWSHPEWLAHLREVIRGIIESGADGVFYDNPWHATEPMHLAGAWLGSAGCYCARCRVAYRYYSGDEIPTRIAPGSDQASQKYLRWRARQVTQTLAELSEYARSLNPKIVISANDYDAVMRPTYLTLGIDLTGLAQVQDVIMIENFALPRWEGGLLVNNALTLRTARVLIGSTPLSTLPYDRGIGFDGVYPPRRFQEAIVEAAACGATAVVKGTEFNEAGVFTLLTAKQFAPQREAIGQINRWLNENAELFQGRTNAARIGLLHPGEELFWHWDQLAPLYFGAGQTLLAAGVPWRVVTAGDDFSGLEVLLTFGNDHPETEVKTISVSSLPGWEPSPPTFLARNPFALGVVSRVVGLVYRAYFKYRWFRNIGDRFGIANLYLASPLFKLPESARQKTLLESFGQKFYPNVSADAPVLAEIWQRGDEAQLHLVNYAGKPVNVSLDFGETAIQGKVLSPDHKDLSFTGSHLELNLDLYSVILWY